MTTSFDITDQVLARQYAEAAARELRDSERELRNAMAVRDEFLALASHELRTPLTTLGLQAEALLRALRAAPRTNPPIGQWTQKAERLRTQAGRLAQLIEGMLEVIGLSRQTLQVRGEECDLSALVHKVVARFHEESRLAKANLELRAEHVVGCWDPRRIDQIVTQLLSNALKFGTEKPVVVSVVAARDAAFIRVRDYGIGIAHEDQRRIFERYERAVTSEHFGGFGLGLWIVDEIVKAMGGKVSVESRPGAGATFSVELPRQS